MTQQGSTLLTIAGWISLAVALACAAMIAADIVGGRRQRMAVMNAVWPISALYLGPIALWAYRRRGRRQEQHPPEWWAVSKGTAHCGAGCTLGDIVGEWAIYALGLGLGFVAADALDSLLTMYLIDFALAWSFGIVFQYYAIVPMREDVGGVRGLWLAVRADTLSIVAFQVGLFGMMALTHLVLWDPPLSIASPGYWLMMQVGMVLGYATSWPVNAWLIRRGWKERM
jgi:hypothetical protein